MIRGRIVSYLIISLMQTNETISFLASYSIMPRERRNINLPVLVRNRYVTIPSSPPLLSTKRKKPKNVNSLAFRTDIHSYFKCIRTRSVASIFPNEFTDNHFNPKQTKSESRLKVVDQTLLHLNVYWFH